MNKISTLLIILLLCSLPILHGQKILEPVFNPNLYKTEIIDSDMGLSSLYPECLHIDRYGFIWIGTQYGLDVYDGYSVTRICDLINDSVSSSMDWIHSITEDNFGKLWVCCSNGLFGYDRTHNRFEIHLPNRDQPDSEDNAVYAIHQDSRGIYWLFTKGGLFTYNCESNLFKDYKKDSILSDESDYPYPVLWFFWHNS